MSSVPSNNIVVFPGCRRDAGQYSSRLLTDQNLTRFNRLNFLQGQLEESTGDWGGNGNAILAWQEETKLDFCLGGYYFHITSGDLLDKVKELTTGSAPNKSLYVYVYLIKLEVTSASQQEIWELQGTDSNNVYDGLYWSESEPESPGTSNTKLLSMQLLIPGNNVDEAKSIFNPKYTAFNQSNTSATESQKYYQFGNCLPYFISSTEFAKGNFSDKNKIWIDNIYFVPHVYAYNMRSTATVKTWEWVPLGAVYKPLGQY